MGRKAKKFYRVNQRITAPQVRLISPEGKSLGVFSHQKALEKAKDKGVDLVEVAPKAKPPVAKLIEYSKFVYQEEKKVREEKRSIKGGETKEVRFSPFIADNDYQVRLERIKEFLQEGHKVKVVVKFLGRQMGKREFGYKLVDRVVADLGNVRVEQRPKFLGRHLIAGISLIKNGQKEKEKNED